MPPRLGVVLIERGGDGEAVLDPGRQRSAPARLSGALEVLAARLRAFPGERGTPRSEKCFRPGCRRPSRTLRCLDEVLLRRAEVVGGKRDVGEPEDRLRRVLEAFREREVESPGYLGLPCRQCRGRDREAALQRFAGTRHIVARRSARAGGDAKEHPGRRGSERAPDGRTPLRLHHGLLGRCRVYTGDGAPDHESES